jgi:hypothetical protein
VKAHVATCHPGYMIFSIFKSIDCHDSWCLVWHRRRASELRITPASNTAAIQTILSVAVSSHAMNDATGMAGCRRDLMEGEAHDLQEYKHN